MQWKDKLWSRAKELQSIGFGEGWRVAGCRIWVVNIFLDKGIVGWTCEGGKEIGSYILNNKLSIKYEHLKISLINHTQSDQQSWSFKMSANICAPKFGAQIFTIIILSLVAFLTSMEWPSLSLLFNYSLQSILSDMRIATHAFFQSSFACYSHLIFSHSVHEYLCLQGEPLIKNVWLGLFTFMLF